MRWNPAFFRASICLLVLLSPIGAPVVGALLSLCPADGMIEPSGPFAMGFSYCGVSRPIEHLYQNAIVLSFLPMAFWGPTLGVIASVSWWFAAVGSAAGCGWYLWRATHRSV
jgi:hypothetical protein